MVELSDHVVGEFGHRGDSLLVDEFLSLIERHHPTDGPGVDRSVVEAYAATLDERGVSQLDGDVILERVESKRTDSGTWVDDDAIYDIGDGRVSTFPAAWHDRLGGSTDVVAFVEFLTDREASIGQGGAGAGVPEELLLDVVAVVGGLDREDAKAKLEELRRSGPLAEDADQHPNARVRLEE
ncbi:hypothetical protein [Halostella litorea]|uniref:hypothetical protein n=1 Tax=Halostella litorea TaxID=2528831 RepID=UPI001092D0E2|nr:hypothetical protein [Halostella litorea]